MPGKHVRFVDPDNAIISPAPPTPDLSYSPNSPTSSGGLSTPPSWKVKAPLPHIPVQLNLLLVFSWASSPPLIWDITSHPSNAIASHVKQPLAQYSPFLSEPATYPPQPHLTLYCPGLSQPIYIVASNPNNGVTIADFLERFYAHVRAPVSQEYLLTLSADQQSWVMANYKNRYRRHPDRDVEKAKGVKLVDFMGTRWLGLTSTKLGPDTFTVNLA